MNHRISGRTYLLLLLLIIAAFVGNFLAARLFTGFNYLFGSISVLVVVRLFGIRWGVLAGFVSSAWTIVLFGHPYAMVWLTLEPLAVGWMLRIRDDKTRNLIGYDALYWSVAGTPLIWIFFQYVMHVPLLGTLAAMLMYWIIGIVNALTASILLSHLPLLTRRAHDDTANIPIRHLIFNLTMVMVLLPALIIMIVHGRNIEQQYRHELYEQLENSARTAIHEIRLRLERHRQGEARADQKPGTPLPASIAFSDILQEAGARGYLQLTVLDGAGTILADSANRLPTSRFTPCPGGTLELVTSSGIQRCMPQVVTLTPLWRQAQLSTYLLKRPLAQDSLWSVVVEGSFAPFQKKLFQSHIQSLLTLVALFIATLGISTFTSHRLAQPLRRLSQLTTDLPERLTKEKIGSWPHSSIAEIDQLIGNASAMADALSRKFQEMTYLTETLELRVAERTRDLSMTNRELQKEIAERKVTERQRDHLMNELVTQVKFLQTLIDAIPNPIFYKDSNGLYQGCNLAFEKQWGLKREQIVGKSVYELFPQTKADIFFNADKELLERRGVQVYETQVRYSDNTLHTVLFSKATYDDCDGNLAGMVGTVMDISERKRAETERDRLTVELTQKNKELEGIIYVASHDLRSPLVNAQGFSRKLVKTCAELEQRMSSLDIPEDERSVLKTLISESIPRSLGFITSSVEKMDGLLSGLLRLSRLGRISLCYDTIDMQQTLSKIIASLAWQIEKAGARVEVEKLAPCRADTVQVSQIFSNLLDNAIKYRSPERPLLVRVFSEVLPEGIRYCVEDNGIGIPDDHQEKAWEIFHRLHPEETSGEGLGLTLVRRIVDRLEGSVWMESQVGSGSRFYVILPAPSAT